MGFMGLTHYKAGGPMRHTGFELSTCETCGKPVQAPNSVTLCEPEARLQALGLKEWEGEMPPEIYYCELTDMSVCDRDACWEINQRMADGA